MTHASYGEVNPSVGEEGDSCLVIDDYPFHLDLFPHHLPNLRGHRLCKVDIKTLQFSRLWIDHAQWRHVSAVSNSHDPFFLDFVVNRVSGYGK